MIAGVDWKSVRVVCACGVCVWCVRVVCACGVCVWCVRAWMCVFWYCFLYSCILLLKTLKKSYMKIQFALLLFLVLSGFMAYIGLQPQNDLMCILSNYEQMRKA